MLEANQINSNLIEIAFPTNKKEKPHKFAFRGFKPRNISENFSTSSRDAKAAKAFPTKTEKKPTPIFA